MNDGGFLLEEGKEQKRFFSLSLWWVEHRAFLRRFVLGVFIAFDAVLITWVGWQVLDAYAISYDREQNAVLRMVALGQEDLNAYTRAVAAEDLEESSVRVLSIGDQRYDLYGTLVNPNDDWWAEFTYRFDYGSTETASQVGFILPSQQKPLTALAQPSTVPIRSAELVIEDVTWRRLDHHRISDYDTWSNDRLNLVVENASFDKETRFDGEVFGRSTFTIINDTAFSYYDVGLYVLLKRGSAVVGVNRTTLSELQSYEEQEVSLNWFGTLPSVSQVEVVPELNIFDVSVYKPLTGETTRDTRTRVFR